MSQESYWDSYYTAQRSDGVFRPSQFATFVLGELQQKTMIFDIGCGNGRDALFFAQAGHRVVGVDNSIRAVNICTATQETFARVHPLDSTFMCASLDEGSLCSRLLEKSGETPRLVYSRFFLHAITDEAEQVFWRLASRLCRTRDAVAVEFRTIRDQAQQKVTPSHFRRFLDPNAVAGKAFEHGFSVRYHVEGFGFAKYRNDDAHVARFVMEKSENHNV